MYVALLLGAVYCAHVYPFLPWGLGGGRPVCATIALTDGKLLQHVGVVDRSSDMILVIRENGDARSVVELNATTVGQFEYCGNAAPDASK
jgi:hypothetical protein